MVENSLYTAWLEALKNKVLKIRKFVSCFNNFFRDYKNFHSLLLFVFLSRESIFLQSVRIGSDVMQ